MHVVGRDEHRQLHRVAVAEVRPHPPEHRIRDLDVPRHRVHAGKHGGVRGTEPAGLWPVAQGLDLPRRDAGRLRVARLMDPEHVVGAVQDRDAHDDELPQAVADPGVETHRIIEVEPGASEPGRIQQGAIQVEQAPATPAADLRDDRCDLGARGLVEQWNPRH